MSTQLYDKEQNLLYPITTADSVTIPKGPIFNGKDNVQACIQDLYSQVSSLKGDDEAVSSIQVDVKYCKLNSNNKNHAIEVSESLWQNSFLLPDSDRPYVWKRTKYTFSGDASEGKTVYEIVATDIAEKIQNIYIAVSSTTQPTITYESLKDSNGDVVLDENENPTEDLTCFDKNLPNGWSETPQSVSAAAPHVYLSTRKKVDGKWERFTNPALFGKWTFDSYIEIRYQIADTKPTVSEKTTNPGDNWITSTPDDFTGKLWIITGTSVNGELIADKDGVVWKGPNLISIV